MHMAGTPARDETRGGGIDAVANDSDAVMAMVIAMAARNGVEDLHAEGVFGDAQAPRFNRLVRGRVYEALLALRYRESRDGPLFADYFAELLTQAGAIADPDEAVGADVLRAAVTLAVAEFAMAEGITGSASSALERAAVEAASTYAIEPLRTSTDPESKRQLAFLAWMVPTYWEPPEIREEFAALLAERSG
jgi:hypothetical protein